MLAWMTGSKSDHPMADEKNAKALLADLPKQDPYKTLAEISHWLEVTHIAENLKPQRIYEIIDLLDQAARPHQRKLAQEYLAAGVRQQKFQEQRIWSTVTEYCRQLGAAYEFCLAQARPKVLGSIAIKAQIPLIAMRAARALAQEMKWSLARYAPVDPTLWGRLGAVYQQAEGGGYAQKLVEIYPGTKGESSVQREYLKALMLSMSSTDSLLPGKLEVAERLVGNFADRFVLEKQAAKGCHYVVDLQAATPPARLIAKASSAPTQRFFGPGTAAEQVESTILRISASGAIPSDMLLGGEYEPTLVVDVLRHLARYWSPVPPVRGEERTERVARIHVVHAFQEVVGTLAGESMDLDFQQKLETWTVRNMSDSGYGAVIPAARSDWLQVGTLLGIKLEDSNSWSVGVVRRLSNDGSKQRYVGIQTLTKGGTPVKLQPVNASGDQIGEDAVLLPSSGADSLGSGELNLLMRMGSFSAGQNLKMRAYGREYLLVPKQLIEGGQDFDIARFRVMRR